MRKLDELRGLGFTRFPLKYKNRCCICGLGLDEGQMAYGTRVGTKWQFLCEACHSKLASAADESPPIPEDLSDDFTAPGGDFLDDEFIASLNLEVDGGFKSDPSKPAPVKKTVMQLISENAQWKI